MKKDLEKNSNKSLIVIDGLQYHYHYDVGEILTSRLMKWGYICSTLDLSTGKKAHEYYKDIVNVGADLIITLDMAGYQFTTELETPSLNTISCRIVNIVFASLENLEHYFKLPLNFSMFFYCDDQENIYKFNEKYPNVPNLIYHKLSNHQQIYCIENLTKLVDTYMKDIESIFS